jgi:hypothetical protein
MVSNTPWTSGARSQAERMERVQDYSQQCEIKCPGRHRYAPVFCLQVLRKQLRIQNVDTVVSNMGAERLSHGPSNFRYSFGLEISGHHRASQTHLHTSQHQSIQTLLIPEWRVDSFPLRH